MLRSADGRGPLFWAHEAKNEEVRTHVVYSARHLQDSQAIKMLIDAGAQEDWQDADGNTCKNFPHGQMTEYMVRPKLVFHSCSN